MNSCKKPVLLSGIQPTGNLTIGNYIGAIRQWIELQEQYDCLFVLVDLHAITVRQNPAELRRTCYDFLALYLACGIDPTKSTIFVQSHVPSHAELACILNCFTYMGELNRMTQFKDKTKRHGTNVNVGLFDYPVLMAADILLYQTDLVPVGEDQKQHLEQTRDIAQRFNRLYGKTFQIPEPYIPPLGARIMSLQDPTSKMSKSDQDPRNYVALLDPTDAVHNKIKKAVTDSGNEIGYDESRPAISNLMTIYSSLTKESFESLKERYAGKGYTQFKVDLASVIIEMLEPIQSRYREIRENESYIDDILEKGAEQARGRSRLTIRRVYQKLGFIPASK